jgi:glycosyltransferase involved in cell wall biosynthesis
MTWIVAQLGAREHYAVARGLHRHRRLDSMITDLWVRPGSFIGVTRNLQERFHRGLMDARVRAPNVRSLAFEARSRLRRLTNWDLITQRNDWFQRRVVVELTRICRYYGARKFTLFAYSYAARQLFEFAREHGWLTILGQIDPGPMEERLIGGLYEGDAANGSNWQPAPSAYWEHWRSECTLADQIVVNSRWSRDALLQEGVAPAKIRVVPLACETPPAAESFKRVYPEAFTKNRPMRVLFLGQINLRKGISQLFEAIILMHSYPIEFWFVGPIQIRVPAIFKRDVQICWTGPVTRNQAASYYRAADVFVFPTHSDGFGLTQLEAQAWKLPIIASRFCGDVVQEGINGVLLPEISGQAIANVLFHLLRTPTVLREMSERSRLDSRFSVNSLASVLLSL